MQRLDRERFLPDGRLSAGQLMRSVRYGTASPLPALRLTVAVVGADRLVLGTDYPFEQGPSLRGPIEYTLAVGLPGDQAKAIVDGNAAALGLQAERQAFGKPDGNRAWKTLLVQMAPHRGADSGGAVLSDGRRRAMSPECHGWFKSSFSGSGADCVEVQLVDEEGGIKARVRNSRRPDGPVLVFDRGGWEAFELGVFNGEFMMPRMEETKAGGDEGWSGAA